MLDEGGVIPIIINEFKEYTMIEESGKLIYENIEAIL